MNHCKNCLSTNIKILQSTPDYNLIKCYNCSFYYKDIGEYDYDSLSENAYTCYNANRKKEVQELDRIIKRFCKKNSISVVEIGSGTSAILNEFNEMNYDVIGVEPSKVAVQISKKIFPKVEVINDYFTSTIIKQDIDVILMYDVMEHLEPNNKVFEEIYRFMGQDTLLLLKSGNPLSFNAQLHFTRWLYVLINQHISFYSYKALSIFCENKNLKLMNYYKFKHAYGGIAYRKILKNLLKVVLKALQIDTLLNRKFSIELANDHFIAVIKKNVL